MSTITPPVRRSITSAQAICDEIIIVLEGLLPPGDAIAYGAALGDVRDLLGLLADGTAADIIE